MRKNEEERGAELVRYMTSVLLGGVTALLICVSLLFVCALAISAGWLNEQGMMQYILASCVISCLLGGMYAVFRCQGKTLVVGVCVGVIFFLLLLTVGLVFYPGMSVENHGVGLACAGLAGGALAGVLGGKKRKKKRRK